MKAQIINSWEDISLNQFIEITKLQSETTDSEKFTNEVLRYLYDEEPQQIPYTLYLAQINGLNQFFNKPVSQMKVSKSATYNINGTIYELDVTPNNFTTAQYIDFTTFSKEASNLVNTLTTVLIPQGHKYNDGYDVEKVRQDIGSMPCSHALGIVNFFVDWSRRSIVTILRFLTARIRRMKTNKEKTKQLRNQIKTLSQLLESFPSC
jgi:hypothetical protein